MLTLPSVGPTIVTTSLPLGKPALSYNSNLCCYGCYDSNLSLLVHEDLARKGPSPSEFTPATWALYFVFAERL